MNTPPKYFQAADAKATELLPLHYMVQDTTDEIGHRTELPNGWWPD